MHIGGDVNPYGVAMVPASDGRLMACPGGVGLTTALGSLATTAGGALPAVNPAGCLIVLNNQGTVVETITGKNIVGPWDLAVTAVAGIFVVNDGTNALDLFRA